MPCYVIRKVRGKRPSDLPMEVEGFLCGKFGPPCVQCGAVSEVLCDFPLPDGSRTCDKPLCLDCAPTVGVDKNYCTEHLEHGPGLVLFRRDARAAENAVQAEVNQQLMTTPRKAKRLPKAPEAGKEWCVLRDGIRITAWMNEIAANRHAANLVLRGVVAEVFTWEQFVAAWRARYPLKPRTPKPKR